jgi:uncharacterized protein YjbI with pentapeptide repeats
MQEAVRLSASTVSTVGADTVNFDSASFDHAKFYSAKFYSAKFSRAKFFGTKTDRSEFAPIVLFSAIGVVVALVAILSGVSGAWY